MVALQTYWLASTLQKFALRGHCFGFGRQSENWTELRSECRVWVAATLVERYPQNGQYVGWQDLSMSHYYFHTCCNSDVEGRKRTSDRWGRWSVEACLSMTAVMEVLVLPHPKTKAVQARGIVPLPKAPCQVLTIEGNMARAR